MLNLTNLKAVALQLGTTGLALFATATTGTTQPIATVPPFVFENTNLTDGTHAYRPLFYYDAGLGDLVQYEVSSTGEFSTSVDWSNATSSNPIPVNSGANWSAQGQFEEKDAETYWRDSRTVIFQKENGAQSDFNWSSLSETQKAFFGSESVVNYIRGDRSNESPNGEAFRKRAGLLGSIINSNAVFVGPPAPIHSADDYQTFYNKYAERSPRVVVGANDGMVHVFNAETGDEVFGYIPSILFPQMANLTGPQGHRLSLVDGPITTAQVHGGTRWAQGGDAWRTIAVGSLGAGGKGFYALDLTQDDTANKVLWEISDSDDASIGFTYSQVQMARFENGKFYAIAGNGYDSGSGKSTLLVIDPVTGSIVTTISYTGGGLSSPTLIDSDNNRRIDRIYAGDVDGQLFRYDVREDAPDLWRIFNGQAAAPLFNAHQPITIAPSVSFHPVYGHLISFGTGKLTSSADLDLIQIQSVYGLWDRGAPIDTAELLNQTVSNGIDHTNGRHVRTLSANRPADDLAEFAGWRVALPSGMQVIDSPIFVRAKRLKMTVAQANTNTEDNVHWAAEFDYIYGGAFASPIYDLSEDGEFNDADLVAGDGQHTAVPMFLRINKDAVSGPSVARLENGVDVIVRNRIDAGQDVTDPPEYCENFECAGDGHFDYDTYHLAKGSDEHTHYYGESVMLEDGTKVPSPNASLYLPMGYKHEKPFDKDAQRKRGVARRGDPDDPVEDPPFATDEALVVLMINAEFSPGVYIQVGENTWRAPEYQRLIQEALEDWKGGPLTTADNKPLTVTLNQLAENDNYDIQFFVEENAFQKDSILGGDPSCYKKKTFKNAYRWRNGAISSQVVTWRYLQNSDGNAVDRDKLIFFTGDDLPSAFYYAGEDKTVILREANKNYGGIVIKDDKLAPFFEGTIYHHDNETCYGSRFRAPETYDVPRSHEDFGKAPIEVICSGPTHTKNCQAFDGEIGEGNGDGGDDDDNKDNGNDGGSENGESGKGGSDGGNGSDNENGDNDDGTPDSFNIPSPLNFDTPGPTFIPGRKAWVDAEPQ